MVMELGKSTSDRVRHSMEELRARVGGYPAKKLYWERLTDSERKTLDSRLTDEEWNRSTATDLCVKLRGVSRERAMLDVGLKCDVLTREKYQFLVQQLGLHNEGRNVDIETAIETHSLVLCDEPSSVTWKMQPVERSWADYPVIWTYFWKLAKAASHGGGVEVRDFEKAGSPKVMSQWKNRLKSEGPFPRELGDLIHVRDGQHQLELDPHEIACFERISEGRYRQITA